MSSFNGVVANRIVVASSAVKITKTGNTDENIFVTVNIPPLQPNSIILITHQFSANNNANLKNAIIRFSGAAGTKYLDLSLNGSVNLCLQHVIQNRGVTNSQVGRPNVFGTFTITATGLVTSTVDTSVATTLVFSGLLANAADSINLESYLVEIINP
jgi:hypothetical protein